MFKATSNTVSVMRVFKIASCPSNSGKGTLTYHVGCDTENDIKIRIVVNTGGGLFSPEWISLSDILPALEQAPYPLTSFPLIILFHGRSSNTPAFLMAALKSEGFVRNLEGKIRGYELLDSKVVIDEMRVLIASNVDLKVANIDPEYKTSYAINKKAKPITKSATPIKSKNSSPSKDKTNPVSEAPLSA
jgi:hypothetical protein